jgi:aspartyl-tRNA(Asn)/glutamyl-tRNA(Gln) amidotransferase subunit B
MRYEPVIGLEIHVQLKTRTNMCCGDPAELGAEPHTHVCPGCLALPGALPVLNGRAVELGIRAAVGLHCTVQGTSIFARKNYSYPDLPKGYQITQYDRPLATEGWVDARIERGSEEVRRVRVRRIHLEEDAGKSIHDRIPGKTAIDLNRAGVPLVEIVTEPDLVSPAHAREFLTRLKQILEYLEVRDCDMEKGSLRVDANVSVRPEGSEEFGVKTELKNMNSFANVERAVAFEIERQIALIEAGGTVVSESLLWDPARGEARAMRSKGESHDYRYFPEPDLPPLVLEPGEIDAIRAALPELPAAKLKRFREEYTLPEYDAEVLTATREVADYFEETAREAGDPKAASNWIMTEVLGWLNQRQCLISEIPVTPANLAQLIGLIADGTLSTTLGRQVFARMTETGRPAAAIVQEEGLSQVRDTGQLEAWVDAVIAGSPVEADRYRQGNEKLLGFFMGQIMRKSQGKADPKQVTELLRRKLGAG